MDHQQVARVWLQRFYHSFDLGQPHVTLKSRKGNSFSRVLKRMAIEINSLDNQNLPLV